MTTELGVSPGGGETDPGPYQEKVLSHRVWHVQNRGEEPEEKLAMTTGLGLRS